MVERFHRQLKAALSAHNNASWSEALPFALLGKRNTVKQDLQATPASLVYGATLRLPADLLTNAPPIATNPSNFASRLASHMRSLKPTPTRPASTGAYIPPLLSSAQYVFLRCDAVRRPLQPPYTGPHKVLRRSSKTFVIDVSGREETVSIDRLKPAYVEEPSSLPPSSTLDSQQTISAIDDQPSPIKHTRSGRTVHFPARFLT